MFTFAFKLMDSNSSSPYLLNTDNNIFSRITLHQTHKSLQPVVFSRYEKFLYKNKRTITQVKNYIINLNNKTAIRYMRVKIK